MKEKRYLVDTTLRDGEQSPGYALSKEQKVAIAGMLDEAGVYQIEAGIPAIGAYERDTLREIVSRRRNSRISVWSRLSADDIKLSFECSPDVIHIGVPVSYAQIYTKMHKNKTWIIKTTAECIDLVLRQGIEVSIGFEDASRADPTFMLSFASKLKGMGVNRIRFADTVGVLSPSRTYHTVSELISFTGLEVEMHAHNDLGMAVANSLAAAKAGAKYIDTTIFGIGERAGNCNFERFVHASEFCFSVGTSHSSAMNVERQAFNILNSSRNMAECFST